LRTLVLLLAVLLASSCTVDVVDSSYASMSDAVMGGAVQRGWVPGWIPPDAKDLQEVHDLDSNQSALAFTAPVAWDPPAHCRPDVDARHPGPAFTRQWLPPPEELVKVYEVFRCAPGPARPMHETVAIRRDTHHVVHWRVLAD